MVRRWDTENYPNILFIRRRPLDRYISSGKREREGERKNEEKRWRKRKEEEEEEEEAESGQRRVVTRRKGGDRAAGVSAWNL